MQMNDDSSSFGSSSKSKNDDNYSAFGGYSGEQKKSFSKQHPFEKTEKTLFELANADRLLIF